MYDRTYASENRRFLSGFWRRKASQKGGPNHAEIHPNSDDSQDPAPGGPQDPILRGFVMLLEPPRPHVHDFGTLLACLFGFVLNTVRFGFLRNDRTRNCFLCVVRLLCFLLDPAPYFERLWVGLLNDLLEGCAIVFSMFLN